jgi:hypothetical protein
MVGRRCIAYVQRTIRLSFATRPSDYLVIDRRKKAREKCPNRWSISNTKRRWNRPRMFNSFTRIARRYDIFLCGCSLVAEVGRSPVAACLTMPRRLFKRYEVRILGSPSMISGETFVNVLSVWVGRRLGADPLLRSTTAMVPFLTE